MWIDFYECNGLFNSLSIIILSSHKPGGRKRGLILLFFHIGMCVISSIQMSPGNLNGPCSEWLTQSLPTVAASV